MNQWSQNSKSSRGKWMRCTNCSSPEKGACEECGIVTEVTFEPSLERAEGSASQTPQIWSPIYLPVSGEVGVSCRRWGPKKRRWPDHQRIYKVIPKSVYRWGESWASNSESHIVKCMFLKQLFGGDVQEEARETLTSLWALSTCQVLSLAS